MTVDFRKCDRGCNCSHCQTMRYGLNIPAGWRHWNAWWCVKLAPRRYLRWTMPRFLFGK